MINFSVKSNRNYSLAYAAYEILEQDFKTCDFKNPLIKEKLAVNFGLESKEKQYQLEDIVLSLVDKTNLSCLNNLKCEVIVTEDPKTVKMIFFTGIKNIYILIKKGKNPYMALKLD